jgi:hypothetical protein
LAVIAPRVRVRVRPRCDDCDCPSPWSHPLVVAGATVVFQVIGEVVARRLTASEPAEAPPEPERPSRKRGAR